MSSELSQLSLITESEDQTKRLASKIAPTIKAGDVICLTGDLGAGKTHFVQGLALALGIEGQITSPTFTIIKEYSGRLPLYHFDVFRLAAPKEMAAIGYEEYFFGDGVTVIEWGDKIADLLPKDHLVIEFHRVIESENRRMLIVKASGPRSEKLKKELADE